MASAPGVLNSRRPPHPRPKEHRRVARIAGILDRAYGTPRLGNKDDPLDELIYIILSAKTADASFQRTYETIHARFPGWFGILDARRGVVARAIREGGLSRKKEGQIRGMLRALVKRGAMDLAAALRPLSDEEAEAFLVTLPGVGKKTARCVLMYSMGRAVFPVDTHVARLVDRLGWFPRRRLTDAVQDQIQASVPPDLRYALHVEFVTHGRRICRVSNPRCEVCVLRRCCIYYSQVARTRRPRIRGSSDRRVGKRRPDLRGSLVARQP